jgi:chloramphenicol-sensitive protein RarD
MNRSELTSGTLYAMGAFVLWGVLPVYWKLLHSIPPGEILAHRIFWSAVSTSFILLLIGKRNFLTLAGSRRNRLSMLLTGLLVGTNWFIYIYAVNSDQIVEASMGYYINPLISIFLGLIVLKEPLNRVQWGAFALAVIGVLIITVQFGRIPWIAVALSGTFGLYGLVKKIMNLDALSSLAIETLFLAPIAGGYIFFLALNGTGSFLAIEFRYDFLLFFSGAVTALPLYWFAQGARRIPLSRIGFLQYIAPSLMLIMGVLVYKEAFTQTHAISFGCIWTALVLYTLSLIRRSREIERRIGDTV